MKSIALCLAMTAAWLAWPCPLTAQVSRPATSSYPSTSTGPSTASSTNPATASAPSSAQEHRSLAAKAFFLTLVSLGVVTLAVWAFRRCVNPRKLLLIEAPGRPNTLNPAFAIGVLLISVLVPLTVSEIYRAQGIVPPPRQAMLAARLAAQAVQIVLCLVVAAQTFQFGIVNGFGLSMRHWIMDTGRAVLGYLAVLPVVFGLSTLFVEVLLPESVQKQNEMLTVLKDLSPAWRAFVVFSAVIAAPIAEEFFYRGIVQSMFRRYLLSPWIAIGLTSGIFAIMHAPYWQDMVPLFALSIVLGYNYERCGRLLPSILIHALFNLVMILTFMATKGLL